MKITLTIDAAEAHILTEALDSHIYWQLSDELYRRDGYVDDPGSDDPDNAAAITEAELLTNKINAASDHAKAAAHKPKAKARGRKVA
jgi:hypothetical protein